MKRLLLALAIVTQGVVFAQQNKSYTITAEFALEHMVADVIESDSSEGVIVLEFKTYNTEFNYTMEYIPDVKVGDKFVIMGILKNSKHPKRWLKSKKQWSDFMDLETFKSIYL